MNTSKLIEALRRAEDVDVSMSERDPSVYSTAHSRHDESLLSVTIDASEYHRLRLQARGAARLIKEALDGE